MQALALSQDLALGLGLRTFDPAALLLGNEPKGLAIDGPSLRGLVRGDGVNWSGNINDLLTYSSPSTKWIVNKAGVLESGTALRCEYDGAGNALGVRVEPQSTNTWPRSRPSGGTVGVIGAGGVMPTSWDFTTSIGLTCEILAIAPDGIEDGVPGIKVRLSGVSTGGTMRLRVSGSVLPAIGDTYTTSTFVRAVAGSMAGISGMYVVCVNGGPGPTIADPFAPTRMSAARWVDTAAIPNVNPISSRYPELRFSAAAGAAVDITLLIGGVQFEKAAAASSYIPTDASAVTRAADDITLPLADFPWNAGSGTLKLNGATVTPILNGGSTALDIDAMVTAASATHLKTLTWVPA